MKNVKVTIAALVIIGFVSSCGETKTDEAANKSVENTGTIVSGETLEKEVEIEKPEASAQKNERSKELDMPDDVVSKYAYDVDFESIKTIILKSEELALMSYSKIGSVDTKEVIEIFKDEDFAKLLEESTYESLTESENEDGEIELVWSGVVSDEDDQGNVWESGVYLYFEQGDPNLKLVKVLAAG